MLSVRSERAADRIRTGTARITTSDAAVTPRPPRRGDERTRTGGLWPDRRVLLPVSYAPKWRGWDSNPRSRAHEAREDSRSSTARRASTRSGRQESNLRSPAPEAGGVARSLTTRGKYPGGSNRIRVEGPASSPVRPRGREQKLRRQGSNLRLTINSRASFLSTTPERAGSEAEGEGVEPPRPVRPTRFRDGVPHTWQPFQCTHGSGRSRTCTTPIKSQRLSLLSYEAKA